MVLRILVIAACIVIAVSGVYLYCLEGVKSYYDPAEGDLFNSSMELKNIFPMNDGRIVVVGTFLPGDDVYGAPSVFLKSYDEKGNVADISSVTLDDDYSFSSAVSDGELVLIIANNSVGDIKTYGMTSDFRLTSMDSRTASSEDKLTLRAGIIHSKPFIAVIENGYDVLIKSGTRTLLDAELSEDVNIDSVYFSGNTFYLTGKVKVAEDTFPYICGFAMSGYKKFEITVSEKFRDFKIDGMVFLADGKTYVTGRQFNATAYSVAAGNAGMSDSDIAASSGTVGDRAVISERSYGPVFITNDYISDPWCTRFICPIDADTGELGKMEKLLDDGPDLGVTDIFYSDAMTLKEGATADNPENKTVIATLVSKHANTSSDASYVVNVYLLFSDMTTSLSADIVVPSDHYYYPGTASDGSLFVYTGISDEGNRVIFSMKHYAGTAEAAREQTSLPVLKEAASFIASKIDAEFIVFCAVYLILYTTARYRGTDNAKTLREAEAEEAGG